MKIISWNVRGLGDPDKRSIISFFALNKVDIIMLQETKSVSFTNRLAVSLAGRHFDQWVSVDAINTAGGLCLGWNSGLLEGFEVVRGNFFLTVKFKNVADRMEFNISTVYGTPYHFNREEFWLEFRSLFHLAVTPWVIGGDFNITRFVFDRRGNPALFSDSSCFNGIIREFGLNDLPISGGQFTWSNHRIHPSMVKLDRFLVSQEWDSAFPNSHVCCLASDVSDHVPLLFRSDWDRKRFKLFRFKRMWTLDESFSNNVRNWWTSPSNIRDGVTNLVTRLRLMRSECKKWSRTHFGSINKIKIELLNNIRTLDIVEEDRDLTMSERADRLALKNEYQQILRKEEIMWKQRSKVRWLKEGDYNTKFFHRAACFKHKKNFISGLMIEDSFIRDESLIREEFFKFYKNLMGSECRSRFHVDWDVLGCGPFCFRWGVLVGGDQESCFFFT